MNPLVRTARWTGAAYLSLAVSGMLGFLIIRPQLHADGNPAATLANLAAQPWLAQTGIALELLIVVAQAVAAVGFYALFRGDRPVTAYAVAAFGMANAIAILGSAATLVAAAELAVTPSPVGEQAAAVGLLYAVSGGLWTVGAVFFGLWLIPMGWFAVSTGRMPRVLGWILAGGGVAYVLSAFLTAAGSGVPTEVADAATIPATVGEFWMIGYLLVRGIRPSAASTASAPRAAVAAG
jgi:hypothetical protein